MRQIDPEMWLAAMEATAQRRSWITGKFTPAGRGLAGTYAVTDDREVVWEAWDTDGSCPRDMQIAMERQVRLAGVMVVLQEYEFQMALRERMAEQGVEEII